MAPKSQTRLQQFGRLTHSRQVDLIIDGGNCGHEPTTVVDLVDGIPLVVRRGKGDVSPFQV